ncbi:hypothetical protein [Lysobacter sp. A421]
MGAPAAPTGTERGARQWRKIIAKGAGAFLLLMFALTLGWFTRPGQVADLILERVGQALGLEITSSGASEYRLRGTPRLVVRDVIARQPGAETPLLTAERIYLSLPWTTLRAAGGDLTVQRAELDAPRVDLAALQHWLDSRPPGGEFRIPTITDGVQVTRGEIIGDGWSIDRIGLDTPSLHPESALAARISGRGRFGTTIAPFDLQWALTRPTLDAGLGAAGIVTVVTPDWRLPMQLQLSGQLHDGDDGLGLDRFQAGADIRWLDRSPAGSRDLAFAYGVAGPLRYRAGNISIIPMGTVLRGGGPIPSFDARGALAWGDTLALQLDGVIAEWPDSWPALPAPLDQSGSPLPFKVDYTGPLDLSGVTSLQLERDDTRLDSRLQLPAILDWLDQLDTGTPLPPLSGTLVTPRIEIAGATLTGVEIRFDNGDDEHPGDSEDSVDP